MNIIERGQAFRQELQGRARRTAWDWRRCPHCGETLTCKWGYYPRRPWTLTGRQTVRVQRHRCARCARTYAEESPWLVRGGWYAREVRRCAIDQWLYLGSSTRRIATVLRSVLGHQERWQLWQPLAPASPEDRAQCHLHASTLDRWLDAAGYAARQTVPDQLAGITPSGQVATDGLWVRLRRGTAGVVLLLTDAVTGVIWPPVADTDEARAGPAGPWARLFRRAQVAGLDLEQVRGLTSDGVSALETFRRKRLPWVSHQRCVFHLWRGLAGVLAQQVAAAVAALALVGTAATAARQRVRRELVTLLHAIFDAPSYVAAEQALARLATHPWGAPLATRVRADLDAALIHLCGYNRGQVRVGPEWCWRDFRLRLSHGRNQGTLPRLERAALLWAVFHNFEPTQARCERRRAYRHPGQCPLAVAGADPGPVCYLDALGI